MNGFLHYEPVDIQLVAFILVIIFLFLSRSITFADQSYAYTLIKISSPIVQCMSERLTKAPKMNYKIECIG